jgi:hypothetical protein
MTYSYFAALPDFSFSSILIEFFSFREIPRCFVHVLLLTLYAVPKIMYGLEVLPLKKKEMEQMEIMQRKLLRQLQCLSNQVANTADEHNKKQHYSGIHFLYSAIYYVALT